MCDSDHFLPLFPAIDEEHGKEKLKVIDFYRNRCDNESILKEINGMNCKSFYKILHIGGEYDRKRTI